MPQVDEDGRRELPERAMEMLWRPCEAETALPPCPFQCLYEKTCAYVGAAMTSASHSRSRILCLCFFLMVL